MCEKGTKQAYEARAGSLHRRAMELVIADIRTRQPKRDVVYISFKPKNLAARALYETLGFEPDGREEDGETIYRLRL